MTWTFATSAPEGAPCVDTAPAHPVAGPLWPSGCLYGSSPLIVGPDSLTLAKKMLLGLTPPAIAWKPAGQLTIPKGEGVFIDRRGDRFVDHHRRAEELAFDFGLGRVLARSGRVPAFSTEPGSEPVLTFGPVTARASAAWCRRFFFGSLKAA